MRRLIWAVIACALLWSGWWLFASSSMQANITRWFENRRDEGWQAEVADIVATGFPMLLEATLVAPQLADPETGVAFEASSLAFSAPAWWPGYVTVNFPPDDIILATPLTRRAINAKDAVADLRLHPGTALQLKEMALTSGAWSLTAPAGSIVVAQGMTLRMKQAADTPTRYDFTVDAPAFQPGSLPRQALRIPMDWPVAFDSLALDASVVFDRPFDRSTIETERPQPRRIDLRLAEAVWGNLLLRAAAVLDVDAAGVPNGEVSLQTRNWQDILTLSETAGVLPSALRPQLENILGALARGGGNPDTIDVTITIREGTMFLGFVPLGPAPRIVLR